MTRMRSPRGASAAHGVWRGSRAEAAGSLVGAASAALRRGREAVVEIDGQLGEILDCLSDGSEQRLRRLARDLPDRMAASSRRAGAAFVGLGALVDGPAGSELF
jgi:hypothetical protein